MLKYKALHGDAGVSRYRSGKDYIEVEFQDGSTYLYTSTSASKASIDIMKKLAIKGVGLTTYINQNVRGRYAAILK